ncbi:uncharacterized protein LOC133532262 [Cydia pomonella]|uniref:uncharacterized protein LOC133532262 n=1 Tax=Cydia pomonella TaxID=82600 RepID=UPI002ADDC507|nr:uncharacterized protein LOC133532262 [Cydia pomonella]
MVWIDLAFVAVFFNVGLSQCIRCPSNKLATTIPTVLPTVAPTIVDGNVVQSLIDTLQLFIVSDLIADTLPEKKCCIKTLPEPCLLEYDDFGLVQYELIGDRDCICNLKRDCTSCVPKCGCECVSALVPSCDQLILSPFAPELPCGLGYMPGGLPGVAKAFAPCSNKGCGCGCGCECECGCGCGCSAGALPVCSPYSCAALAVPLCPNMSPLVKPIIL